MTAFAMTRRSALMMAPCALVRPALAQTARLARIGLSSSSFGASAARVTKEMGLFAAHGIDARLIVMESGNAAIAGVLSGSLEFGMSGPGEVIVACARGQKLVLIVNGYRGLAGTLVLRKDVADKLSVSSEAPIAARFSALGGLLIGSPSATSVYTVAFRNAMKDFAAGELRFTYINQPSMTAALESGAIQGFIAGAPFWASPVLRGVAVSWISGPKGELPLDAVPSSSASLTTTQDFAMRERDFIGRFRAAFADLGVALRERPVEVRGAIARLFPELDAQMLDLLIPLETPPWAAGPVTSADVEHDIAFAKKGGLPIPNIDQISPASLVLE
jgi:sulfonate transport system substrate-binding protein